jgi:hypothetical protein
VCLFGEAILAIVSFFRCQSALSVKAAEEEEEEEDEISGLVPRVGANFAVAARPGGPPENWHQEK